MKKRLLLGVTIFLLFMLIGPLIVMSSETGCCTNPDSLYARVALCNEVSAQMCCTGADDYEECVEQHFYPGEKCYDTEGEVRPIAQPYCEFGCCCIERDGRILSSVVQRAGCDGEFDPDETDRDNCLYNICEGEGELPIIEIEDRQCVYYYCEGNIIPQGPEISESGINLIYAQGSEGIFEEIDSLITAGLYTDDNYWIATEEGYLYLFDSNRNLVTNNLEDYEMEENPTLISNIFDEVTHLNTLAAFIHRSGHIYFTQGNHIYEYSVDGFENIGDTSQLYESPSIFNSMSTYASYLYDNYLIMAGYNNRLNFFTPATTNKPFDDLTHIESVMPTIGNVDVALEIYSGGIQPCLMFIGSCDTFHGCKDDEHCSDFNQCTIGECLEDGSCHFDPKDDMESCLGEDGYCCGGQCFTDYETINSDFHENCRSEQPNCDDEYFLRYEKGNEGGPCAGDCFVCNEGYCDERGHDLCTEDGEYCNKNGECVQITGDECDELEDRECVGDDRIRECIEYEEGGETYLIWSSPEDCHSDICEKATCEDGECGIEYIEEGDEDPEGCYGEEGCSGIEDCKCDGQGECASFCTSSDECDDDNPCKDWFCNEDGQCDHEKIDGISCTTEEGHMGFCENGECIIQTCADASDCEDIVCAEAECIDGFCIYHNASKETMCEYGDYEGVCTGEGRGDNHCEPIKCDPNDSPEEQCPSKECNKIICTPTEFCDHEPDPDKKGTLCNLEEDGGEGYCYDGGCVECYEQDHCDDQNEGCFNNECVECVVTGNCNENEVCSNNECLIDCTHEDAPVCPSDKYCNEETGKCVECIPEEEDHCQENKVCHIDKCVDECNDPSDCSSDEVCVNGACVDCDNNEDCKDNFVCYTENNECVECLDRTGCDEGEHCYNNVCRSNCEDDENCPLNSICRSGMCLIPCNKDTDCKEGMFCHEEKDICVECTQDNDEVCTNKGMVCHDEIGKCVYCLDDNNCQGDDVCKTETNECVQCLDKEDCDNVDQCTANICDTDENQCVESYEEKQGEECELVHGEEGFCYDGDCISSCTDSEECGYGIYDKKIYCYNPSGEEEAGQCVKCYNETHCERDDEGYECKTVKECFGGECRYNYETGTDCYTCGSTDCVCVEGTCIEKCHEEYNPCEGDDKECGTDGYCIYNQCQVAEDCENENSNECIEYSCRNGKCHEEKKEDLTNCKNGEGRCCNGECITDIKGNDFNNDCTDWELDCRGDEVKVKYTNHGQPCGDGGCGICNYGYCSDDVTLCEEGEDCVDGECLVGCQNSCESGDSECMDGVWARLRECVEHPNIEDCHTWNTPERCPDDTCKEPYCTEGECGKNKIAYGQTDGDACWNGYGCGGDICRCDGLGFCVALECETDNDCEDEDAPCMKGNCVDNRCEFEPKEDLTNCPGGRCCGGACKRDIENSFFNESCRSNTPQCVGGSYQYVAENEGDICAGKCAVCDDGRCIDDSYKCSEGQECSNGECVGCLNQCKEGDTRCVDGTLQFCEKINSCLTWGKTESCESDGMCTKGDCVNGECIITNVEDGETDSKCYGFVGCDGDNCKCDGQGRCEDSSPPVIKPQNGENGDEPPQPPPKNGEPTPPQEEGISFWWLLFLIILIVVVVGGFTGAYYYYDKNYNKGTFISKIKSLIGNSPSKSSQKTQGSFVPKDLGAQSQVKSQSPSQAGLASSTSKLGHGRESKKIGGKFEKELHDYLQTLRQKGPDKNKELELMKKGLTTQKIKELYEIVRKENKRRVERRKKIAKFE